MNFWDWPCEMFFSECTVLVVIGVSGGAIVLGLAVWMVAMSINDIRKMLRK